MPPQNIIDLPNQYRLARKLIRDHDGLTREDAEDLVQETISNLWAKNKEVNYTYLRRRLRWAVLNFKRSQRRRLSTTSLSEVIYDTDGEPITLGQSLPNPDIDWPIENQVLLAEAIREVERTWGPGIINKLLTKERRGEVDNFLARKREDMMRIASGLVYRTYRGAA